LGELHHQEMAKGVFLVGHRHEGSGTVLRFQAANCQEIYDVLPDLLAPFRMAEAVDWRPTIATLPESQRGEPLTKLMETQAGRSQDRWLFAERMAEVSEGYRHARVYQIKEAASRGLRIDVYTNERIAEQLCRQEIPHSECLQLSLTADSATIVGGTVLDDGSRADGATAVAGAAESTAVDARDVAVFVRSVDAHPSLAAGTKAILKQARSELETCELSGADKNDTADDLGKITEELGKPQPDDGRIRRLCANVRSIAPTVAEVLRSVSKTGQEQ
jgi:hypothetical protein